ncbi:MAG TPA: hypothetical protein DHV70_05040 [Firmicutes bacterium]|jgi:hypothetical protein|nr:hypothetical protein [Bacillota bacterium]
MEKREELNSLMEKYKEFTSIILKLDKENRKSLSTLDAEEAKNKLTEENKKVKILKPQNEDPFYYWNM